MAGLTLPDGLISIEELGILAEYDDLELDERQSALADLIIRMTGVVVRFTAQQAGWTAENLPYEAKVVALNFARRVFNNPQNQTRITTGPLGESYAPDEVVGMALKPDEEALLETFAEVEGTLSVVHLVRDDPLSFNTVNYDLAAALGLGQGDDFIRLPSLSRYLGVGYGA